MNTIDYKLLFDEISWSRSKRYVNKSTFKMLQNRLVSLPPLQGSQSFFLRALISFGTVRNPSIKTVFDHSSYLGVFYCAESPEKLTSVLLVLWCKWHETTKSKHPLPQTCTIVCTEFGYIRIHNKGKKEIITLELWIYIQTAEFIDPTCK